MSAMKTLQDRAARALADKSLAWLLRAVPERFHSSPSVMAEMLSAAAQGDPKLAQSPAYRAAFGAVRSWSAGRELADRAARIWHAPEVQRVMGQNAEKYWANPRLAYSELMALSSSNPKLFASERMQEAAVVLAELNSFGETHGIQMPTSASAEQPIDPGRLDEEYKDLVGRRNLTPADQTQLLRLAEGRLKRDAEAGDGRTPAPAGPGENAEYRALQLKVAERGATNAEYGRLVEIAETYTEQQDGDLDERE